MMTKTTTFNPQNQKMPDFNRSYRIANEILILSTSIKEFPFKVKELVKEQSDISFCTYENAHLKYHLDIRQFGSNSAVLTEMEGAHIIFYNQEEPLYRIRYSIIHEFGHVILGHQLNLRDNDPLYGIQEVETNCFAAQILIPDQLLQECVRRGKPITEDYIMKSFCVSHDAASKRRSAFVNKSFVLYSQDESRFDDIIIKKYSGFLDQISPIYDDYSYSLEDEFEMQQERNSWLDTRSRW